MSNYLIISSSGGNGHKVAAKMLIDNKLAKNPDRKIDEVDVMRSGCSYGAFVGKKLTDLWDEAQQQGDIYRQRNLFVLQPFAEKVFFISTFVTVLYRLLLCKEPPKVVCVQPLHLFAITSAVMAANFLKFRTKKIERIDLYFTDLPSDKAEHFMGALNRLRDVSQRAFNMIRVCAPDPINQQGVSSESFWSGYNITHIKRKPLPLNPSFKNLEKLPLPGTAQTITLKNGETYSIKEEDKVAFIMLGSNPERSAILNYVDAFVAASKRKFKETDPTYYLFVACGKGSDSELYKAVCQKLSEAQLNEHVKIVPFENQGISDVFARCDISITRSGGMTSSEISALKSRPQDNKKILIHSPMNENIVGDEDKVKKMLLDQIPLWENGNAEQLMWNPNIKAEVINPRLSQNLFANFFIK